MAKRRLSLTTRARLFLLAITAWLDDMVGRIPVTDVAPVLGGERPVKATVGEPFPVSATVFREGHDRLGAEVVLTDPGGVQRPPVRMEPVPAVSSLARILRDADVARVEPRRGRERRIGGSFIRRRTRAGSWTRPSMFSTGGRKCVIFQLVDDHSRLAVASHVSWGETSEGAIAVVSKGIQAHGFPQRLLSDNGAALNPSRRGVLGQLVVYLRSRGVEPITGKPYKPTTQGKNERFHQTLFRWLDKQPRHSSSSRPRSMRSI